MNKLAFRLLLALFLTGFMVACDSDDDEPADTGGDVSQEDTGGDEGDDDAGLNEDTGGDDGEDLLEEDACLNDHDNAIMTGDEVDQTAEATSCALGNIGEDDEDLRDQLVTECVQEATDLSTSCSSCYGKIVSCTIANCLAPPANCAANSSGEACIACRDEHCQADFDVCAGDYENYEPAE